jgi:hypothetical protein
MGYRKQDGDDATTDVKKSHCNNSKFGCAQCKEPICKHMLAKIWQTQDKSRLNCHVVHVFHFYNNVIRPFYYKMIEVELYVIVITATGSQLWLDMVFLISWYLPHLLNHECPCWYPHNILYSQNISMILGNIISKYLNMSMLCSKWGKLVENWPSYGGLGTSAPKIPPMEERVKK